MSENQGSPSVAGNYNVIFHTQRIALGLSLVEYCIADTVYHISNNPQNFTPGWCYLSYQYLSDIFGIGRSTAIRSIRVLIDKGLLKRHQDGIRLQPTQRWYDILVGWKETAMVKMNTPCSKRTRGGDGQNEHSAMVKMNTPLSYNNMDNNKEGVDPLSSTSPTPGSVIKVSAIPPPNDELPHRNRVEAIPGSVADVIAYMKEKHATDPEYSGRLFFTRYASIGWVVGKARLPMKNWRAAASGWLLRDKEYKRIAAGPANTQPEKKDGLNWRTR